MFWGSRNFFMAEELPFCIFFGFSRVLWADWRKSHSFWALNGAMTRDILPSCSSFSNVWTGLLETHRVTNSIFLYQKSTSGRKYCKNIIGWAEVLRLGHLSLAKILAIGERNKLDKLIEDKAAKQIWRESWLFLELFSRTKSFRWTPRLQKPGRWEKYCAQQTSISRPLKERKYTMIGEWFEKITVLKIFDFSQSI